MSENIVQLLFFSHTLLAIFLFTLQKGNLLSNKLLAVFLFITAFDISNFIFQNFYGNHLNFDMFRANIVALLAPALYFYVKSVLYNDTKLQLKDLPNLLPLLLVNLLFLPGFYFGDIEQKMAFYNNDNPRLEVIIVHFTLYIEMAFYLLLIFKTLIKHKKILLENFSDINQLNHRWLTYFILFFTTDFLIGLFRNIFKFTEYQSINIVLTPLMLFTSLLFVCWIFFQALNNPQLFLGISSKIPLSTATLYGIKRETSCETSKDKIHTLNTDESKELDKKITQLKHFMSNSRPYLNTTLTIESLAKQLNLPTEELSSIINHHLNQHFFDFVNGYRVNLAAEMLQDTEHKTKTILSILYDVGFNSKSSFNTAFKKKMAMTPSQYRQLG